MPIVSIEGDDKEYEVAESEVLFDALDNQGLKLPHGCLAGSCGACRIEILEGKENLKAPSRIEQDTIASIKANYVRLNGEEALGDREVRLACRARVLGDVKFKRFK
jgi:ferredoxin